MDLATLLPPRRLNALAIALGLCLLSPALGTGLVADDFLHQLMLSEQPGIQGFAREPWDLFRFADGTAATTQALINDGAFPWWADQRAQLSFLRPLAALTHIVDHKFWPNAPWLMHLQSLLWYGVLLVVSSAVYRRFSSSILAASLALLIFAIDDAHAPVVGWVANRNALIALSFAMPALLVHDRQRKAGFGHGVWLGPLLFALGLCAGEVATSILAYLLAYAFCIDRGPWLPRLGALLPYLGVLLAWKLVGMTLGYGVHYSGVYIDPLAEPLRFAIAACERLPVLGLALVGTPFAGLWGVYPLIARWLQPAVLVAALLILFGLARFTWPLLRRHAGARFWAVGMVVSLLPPCATFPHDRSLLAPGIGAMALIAQLLLGAWEGRHQQRVKLGGLLLGGVHLVLAPLLGPLRAAHVGDFTQWVQNADQTLPQGAASREQTVVLLNPPIDPLAGYLPIYRAAVGAERPRQQLWLATGASAVVVRTLDTHTIALRPETGFLSNSMQLMLRAPKTGPELGDKVQLDGALVEVTELSEDGRPQEIHVRFEDGLSAPALSFWQWRDGGYQRFELPQPGSGAVLPKLDVAGLMLH